MCHDMSCMSFFFLCSFYYTNKYLNQLCLQMDTTGEQGRGKSSRLHLIMWRGWCFFFFQFILFKFSFSSLLLTFLLPFYSQRLQWHADCVSYPLSCDNYNNSNCIHHSLPLSLYHSAGNRWDKQVGVTRFRDGKWQRDGAQTTSVVIRAIVKFFSS